MFNIYFVTLEFIILLRSGHILLFKYFFIDAGYCNLAQRSEWKKKEEKKNRAGFVHHVYL